MKNVIAFLGKVAFSLPFMVFGCFHLIKFNEMAGMVPKYIPGGKIWVIITGVALISAGISLLIGQWVKLSMILLAIFLVVMIVTIHIPGLSNTDAQMAQMSMMGMFKDLALAGGALGFAALSAKK